jgi:hypothetical protein
MADYRKFLINIRLYYLKSQYPFRVIRRYRKDNINRFGAYFLDELREQMTIDFGLPVVSLSN